MSGFEIVSRRGENKVVEERAAAVPEVVNAGKGPDAKGTVATKGLEWRSVGYTLVFLMVNGNQMLSGRAAGLRTDERLFTADWLLPPLWDEKLNWQWEAKRRLDTFRKCWCDREKRCEFHVRKVPGQVGAGEWLVEDLQRLDAVQKKPLPECLEILMKAEMARSQSRIAVPGR